MSVITTTNLSRTYGTRRGISDVNIRIEPGSLYGFLGPNGAGKTTTIRVLLGFLRPSAGRATIFGRDCWGDSAFIKREVGYVPGDLRLWPWMNGHSALKLFGQIRGRELRRRGKELADVFELDLGVRVRAMSRGMRQKLGLVLAMAHDPKLLVLDEPSSALDPLMQDRFRELLREAAGKGSTVFFSSHTLGEVEALCERVAIVKAGRIVADSTLSELRKQARQEIDIHWLHESGDRIERPKFLHVSSADASRWTGHIDDASLSDLLAFLSGKPVADLRIARPDLETIFRRYYDSSSAVAPIGAQAPAQEHAK